mgnify:CR=1 FL=1
MYCAALANPGVSFSVEDQDTRHTVASIPVVGVSSLARYSQVLGSLGETHEFADMSCTKPRFHGIVCLHAHRKFVLVLLNSRCAIASAGGESRGALSTCSWRAAFMCLTLVNG